MNNKLIKPCLLAVLFLSLVVTAQSEEPSAEELKRIQLREKENKHFEALRESLEALPKIDPAPKTDWWKGGGIWTPLSPIYVRTDD